MNSANSQTCKVSVLVVGGGLGGVSAALAATDLGCDVFLSEETDWLGGQMTSQAVPPDEHGYIEEFGRNRSYSEMRSKIRAYYRRAFPLSEAARKDELINPGLGHVSKISHLPAIGAQVLEEMLLPAVASGKLKVVYNTQPVSVSSDQGRIGSVEFENTRDGHRFWVAADYVLDATELGDLLALAEIDYVSGAESQAETGELHAVTGASEADNVQALTWCFPLAHDQNVNELRDEYAIAKPSNYDYWRSNIPKMEPAWSGSLLSLSYCFPPTCKPIEIPLFPAAEKPDAFSWWRYRQILAGKQFSTPADWHDISLVNWPQNDYLEGNIIDASVERRDQMLADSKQLSLSLAYWLQNEVPRPDGGIGYPGMHLRPDITGTNDGLAKAPYIRESRRIKALFTVTEAHVGTEMRNNRWPDPMRDSVGVGYYRIDLHPSTNGKNYIDIPSLPFQIPLGALIPRISTNLLAAAKNIGTTHITNGCYRLHPIEWNIGEAAGSLAAFCLLGKHSPQEVWEDDALLKKFQQLLLSRGVELEWPESCHHLFIK